ncbi:hypothetical protein FOZ61_001291, partial [Perkinsus olseni]
AEANKKVEEVQEALQRLTAQKAEADKRAEEAEGALEELQEEKANMEKQIARLEKEVESEKAERKRSENETSDMMKDLQKTRAVAFEKINKLETQLSLLRSQEDETSAYSVSPTVVLESPNGGRTSQAAAGVKKTVPSFITSSTPESPLAVTQDGTLDAIRRTSKKRKAVDSHEAPVPKLPESFPLSKKTKASTSMNGTAKWLENGELDEVALLSYRRDNYEVYHCGDHLACSKKWKLVSNGDHVAVFTAGDHSDILRERNRTRHTRKIISYIVDKASRIIQTMLNVEESPGIKYGSPLARIVESELPNFFELEEVFEDSRISQELIDFIREEKLPAKEFVFHGGYWRDNFACVVGGASMLASLFWFIRSMPSGFPLYMDAQNKIIRGSQKVAWVGSSRIWFDTSRRQYRHTFVPFFMAIINEECYDVYHHLLLHLDTLVKALTRGEKSIQSVVSLCVHDAHQGALKACHEVLPNVRNARCYFHLTKNLKDNKSTLGEGFDIVKRHKYWLHASPTDALYDLVSETLIDAVTDVCPRGGEYLERTLDPHQYGHPNIAITGEGVVGNQVLTNIVESFHKTHTRIMGKKRLNISFFAAKIRKVITSLKLSSPQHYVRRPEVINAVDYKGDMRLRGTKFHQRRCIKEVTDMVGNIMHGNIAARYFLLPNNRTPRGEDDVQARASTQLFLRGMLLDELDEGVALTLTEVMKRYFCYYLVALAPQQQQIGFIDQKTPPSFELYLGSRPP